MGEYMKTETWVRLAAIGICAVTFAALAYLLLRICAAALLPFALAALIASLLRPAARRMQRHTRLPEKPAGALLLALMAIAVSALALALGSYVYSGAREMIALTLDRLSAGSGLRHTIEKLLLHIRNLFPQDTDAIDTLAGMVEKMLSEALSEAGAALSGYAAAMIMELPRVFVSFLVGMIALFYLFFDAAALQKQLRFFLSETTLARLSAMLSRVREGIESCLRAYLLLFFVTFAELLAGFLILNVERAVLTALLTALVDLMPVFGVGTVLIPWSILAFLNGDPGRGAGLLILFGVMSAARPFLEPRIVGGSLGIHPLFMLMAVFAGLRLFGLPGMLCAPVTLYAVKAIIQSMQPDQAQTDAGNTRLS